MSQLLVLCRGPAKLADAAKGPAEPAANCGRAALDWISDRLRQRANLSLISRFVARVVAHQGETCHQ